MLMLSRGGTQARACSGAWPDNEVFFKHDRISLGEPPDASSVEEPSHLEGDGSAAGIVGVTVP